MAKRDAHKNKKRVRGGVWDKREKEGLCVFVRGELV